MKDWKYFWHVSAIFCAMWVAISGSWCLRKAEEYEEEEEEDEAEEEEEETEPEEGHEWME